MKAVVITVSCSGFPRRRSVQARPVPEFFSFHPDIQCIQAHSSSSSDEDDGNVENGDCSADDELQTSRDAINVEGATAVIAMKFD